MRATLMYGAGDVRVEDVTDPAFVEPTDAILRAIRACICGSDLWPYNSMAPSETGQSMGHEAIGVAEEIGADVRTVKRGDVVVMPFAISDGTASKKSTRPGSARSGTDLRPRTSRSTSPDRARRDADPLTR